MNNKSNFKAKVFLLLSMTIFGTIGVFRKYIPLPSGTISLVRGVIGSVFMLMLILAKGSRPSGQAIKKNIKILIIAGAFLGINWILLFEAYRYTSVATATLCYYMAPVFMILVSPFVVGERLTKKKVFCAVTAVIGMVLVSGILDVGAIEISELKGIIFALAAAVLYAAVVMISKRLENIDGTDVTLMQLVISAIVLVPYVLLVDRIGNVSFTPVSIAMLLVIGVVHTGIAYALYYSSIGNLKAQTIALFSYIDPVVAVLLSVLVLREEMSVAKMIGAILILGATILSERE
ncbi:MAG: DMT family transporter [Dorea sp.]